MARKPQDTPPAPPREAVPGDNLPKGPMDDSVFLSAVRRHDKFEAQLEALRVARGRFRKDMKTRGIKLKVFDAVMTMRGLERKEVKDDIKSQFWMMRLLQLQPGQQAELFPKDMPQVTGSDAKAAGYQAGIAGEAGKPPPEWMGHVQDWMEGWGEGQAKIAHDFFDKDYFDDSLDEDEDGEAAGPGEEGDDEGDEIEDEDGRDPAADQVGNRPAASNVVGINDRQPTRPAPGPQSKAEADKAATERAHKAAVAKGKKADSKKAPVKADTKADTKEAKPAKAPAKTADKADKPAATERVTKAEEAARNGGVGGQAPAGARRGGGDFDESPSLASPNPPGPGPRAPLSDADLDAALAGDED